jgi:hypothetical protein
MQAAIAARHPEIDCNLEVIFILIDGEPAIIRPIIQIVRADPVPDFDHLAGKSG